MTSLLNMLLGWLIGRPQLVCERSLWLAGARELEKRTLGGRRESGAFLLGIQEKVDTRRIRDFIYYDDIDPQALDSGIVHFHGACLPKLWEICRAKGYGVVADVHVHPESCAQSDSDQANPVMPRAGHFAIILPNFARRGITPGAIGVYEYLGDARWKDQSRRGASIFRLD